MKPGKDKPIQVSKGFTAPACHYLSINFTLDELIHSDTADRLGIDNTSSEAQFSNVDGLCRDLLQPIRDKFGPLRITSGYRCPELNAKIGGAKASAHMWQVVERSPTVSLRKAAADFQPMAEGVTIQEIFDWIRFDSGLPFDQLILERGKDNNSEADDCIHIAWTNCPPRRHAMLGPTHGQGKYVTVESRDPTAGEAA